MRLTDNSKHALLLPAAILEFSNRELVERFKKAITDRDATFERICKRDPRWREDGPWRIAMRLPGGDPDPNVQDLNAADATIRDAEKPILSEIRAKLISGQLALFGRERPAVGPLQRYEPSPLFARAAINIRKSIIRLGAGALATTVFDAHLAARSVISPTAEDSATATPNRTSRVSHTAFERWYKAYVTTCVRNQVVPSRDDDLDAARRDGFSVTHRKIEAARREFAPREWKASGPKSS